MVKATFQKDGTLSIPEGASPSGELHMHMLLQLDARSTRAVVHAHPTHIVAAMYRGFELPMIASQFPEIFRYTRVGPTVPPIPAITEALGEATAEALGLEDGHISSDIVGQHNHGVCSVARDPWAAYEHIERLDHVCEVVLASGVTPDEVRERHARNEMSPRS